MKRPLSILSAILLLLCLAQANSVAAKDKWTSVRSKNFLLIGNADEKAIRKVGTRLEQFREVFTHLFPNAKFNTPVPTTVVVFKSDSSYAPFKPSANIAGYFQAGVDVNYITLTTEERGEQDPYSVIFHEYVHLLIHNLMSNVPTWFDEGLAEYYSSFSITDDQKVQLGKVISSHVFRLREKMMPLRSLVAVDQTSPYYNERDKQSVFYAESWALVHYLLLGNEGKRAPQLAVFVDALRQGVPAEKALQQALGKTFEEMDVELKKYVKNNSYPSTVGHFERKLEFDSEMESRLLGEADVQAYLGDLLLHSHRADAEKYLQKAIELDANQAMGLSALGIFRMRQGKSDEAKQLLQRAVSANAENFLTHYYYAEALASEGTPSSSLGASFSPETIKIMRAELQKAIQLAPTFPESYRLLAFVNMVAHEQLDESVAMLKKALTIVPGNQQIAFMLGQVYLNQQDFKNAKAILVPLAQTASEPELRASVKQVLDSLREIEGQIARYAEQRVNEGGAEADAAVDSSDRPHLRRSGEAGSSSPDADSSDPNAGRPRKFRIGLRPKGDGEQQARGLLMRIDCNAQGATFVVQTKDKVLKLRGGNMSGVQFVSFVGNLGSEIGCGQRNPANPVIVTYRPPADAKAKHDGETVAVEFIPEDFPEQP